MVRKILLLISLVLVYIFFVNFVSTLHFLVISSEKNSKIDDGDVKIGFSDSVGITVIRERFYGKIIQNNKDIVLYLFYFIKLPLKINNFNYLYVHIIFLLIILTILLFNTR